MSHDDCHCDSGLPFQQCCYPYLEGETEAPTPVALMRSRYCAFVTGNLDYLIYTWHPDDCPRDLSLDGKQKWIGLKVLDHGEYEPGKSGWVHFVARYKIAGQAHRLEERSLFSHIHGRWYYRHPDTQKED
tara:strand:- start:15074 stop:15463 length:390 start_codon:yes stop_codon:yes gene_type:complete